MEFEHRVPKRDQLNTKLWADSEVMPIKLLRLDVEFIMLRACLTYPDNISEVGSEVRIKNGRSASSFHKISTKKKKNNPVKGQAILKVYVRQSYTDTKAGNRVVSDHKRCYLIFHLKDMLMLS